MTPESPPGTDPPRHVDVLIVGAGLSGIGAACHLQAEAPGTSYAIVEARGASGGTWDLFRFPGVRSDSDMFTLGYPFRPWADSRSIVGGAEILRYLTYADGYGQFSLGRERFLELPAQVAQVRCDSCSTCTVSCPHGVRVSERLGRAQELFA